MASPWTDMLNINGLLGGLALVGILAAVVVGTAGIWVAFEKAGLSGSNAVAPHLFTYAMIQMAGLRNWKIPRRAFLLGPFLPFLMCYVPFGIARRFGKSRLFGLGLLVLPFVFFPILGFGNSRYSPLSQTGGSAAVSPLNGRMSNGPV
jgi:hypothetical protein